MSTKFLAKAVAFGALTLGLGLTQAQAANCTIYFSGSPTGSIPASTTLVVIGPYTTSCTGSHTGSLTNLSNASLDARIERNVNGSWKDVGGAILSALDQPPGTYRYVIVNSRGGNGNYKLKYSHP
ncbi:hypothetical protein ACDW_10880 [Acidovorax sp. DW039]|uniref:hypothetical protein n=1 Tax=Acidovorax sp. DW039 TaxID=3095606 RepID=UPI00308C6410|nr:hypothetical protein ACDW_10880 [Acidovorax sp. DW039]